MNKRALIVAVVLFVLIVAGMFVFAYLKQQELNAPPAPLTEVATDTPKEAEKPRLFERLDVKHYYKDGTHTLAGEINMPTPCHLLDWDLAQYDAKKMTVIDFDVKNSDQVCTQVVTPQRFKVGFEGPADATFKANLDGKPIELNVIEAAADEDPADFELFIKG